MKNLFTFALIISSLALIAQTGPGGVGNATNNVIWLDAAQISANNGDPVSAWPDKSGNGNNFTQGSPTRQPTYVRTSVNANPIVDFNGDFMDANSISALNTSSFSSYIVARADNNNQAGFLLHNSYTSGSATQSNQLWGTYISTSGNQYYTYTRNSVGTGVNVGIGYLSGYNIISSIISSTSSNITGYFNNTNLGSSSGYNTNPSGHLFTRIGGRTTGSGYYAGNMAEIIVYNTALNSAQHNIINNYLAARYRRPISNDLFAHELTHYWEVFGVGQEADGNNLTAKGTGIVTFSSPTLANGDYIIAGHNNADLMLHSIDIPASFAPASRLQRVWRVTSTGTPGLLTVSFDISGTVYAGELSINLVVENGDGIFNNGGTTIYGPATPVGNVVTFTGVSLPDNSYFTITGPTQPIETVMTGDWSNPTTWNCGCVPGATDNAKINATHTVKLVVVNNFVKDLIIDTNGSLTYTSSRRLFVNGNLTVNGSILNMVANTGRLEFSGTGAQLFTNTSGNVISIYNLALTGGSTVVLLGGELEIANSIGVTSGNLSNASSKVTLLSNSTKTAVILPGASNAFSGQFIIQRYISQRNAGWGDLSSPVSSETLGGWDTDESGTVTELFMSGVNGFDGNAGAFQSVYSFDENTQAYVAVTDTNQALTPGKGFEIWLADNLSTWNAKTFDSKGIPTSGSLAVSVRNGFNLVGNPYANRILWSSLSKPTLKPTFYIWNTNNGSYDAFTNSGIVAHQGFWVESSGNGILTFSESSKSTTTSSVFLRTSEEKIGEELVENEGLEEPVEFSEAQFKLKSTINHYNHTLKIRMNNLASANYDYYDASVLPSRILEAPSIASYSANSNKKLVINSFNYQDEIIIPIAVEVGISGTYIIEAINFENFNQAYTVMELTDNKLGKVYDLTKTKAINVIIDTYDKSDRFSLLLSNNKSAYNISNADNIKIYKANETTVIELEEAASTYTISAYNALGQQIMDNKIISNTNRYVLNNDLLAKGVIIIKITSEQEEVIKKIIY